MLTGAGPISAATRDLLFDAVALMLIVVVPVFVLTALVVWRYRSGTRAGYRPDWQSSKHVEIGIWFAPLIIVCLLGVMVWQRTHDLDPYRHIGATQNRLVVQAVALDWQWLFIYPDQEVAAVNRLVIPAGLPVKIEITSNTVMNALYIPALAGQIYAMAGMTTELNLMADAPGRFRGRNSQFSGNGFSAQTFIADAVDEGSFDVFVEQARATGKVLDQTSFEALAKPTIDGPVEYFGSVQPNIFKRIVNKHDAMPGHSRHEALR